MASTLVDRGHGGGLRGQPMPPHLRYVEGKFRNARGQALFYLAVFPRLGRKLRGVVLYMHAIGDHCRRYAYLYERLCERGFGVIAYDLVGHGASDSCDRRTRAHATWFRYFVDDTNAFLTFAKTKLFPSLVGTGRASSPPLVMSGLSYGTLVGIHTVLSGAHAFAAMCLAGPSLCVEMTPVLKLQAFFARPMSLLIPRLRIVPAVNREWLCRDPAFFEDFDNDPLTNDELLTARMGEQTLNAMTSLMKDSRVEDRDGGFCQVPVLFLVGSEDRVVSLELSRRFFDRLANPDKEYKVFDGLYHCVFEDPERDDVIRYMTDWLQQRFPESIVPVRASGGPPTHRPVPVRLLSASFNATPEAPLHRRERIK